jgi:hypothetical protein
VAERKGKKNRMIAGLIVGVAVFAAAFGMANTLGGITANTLGADDQSVGTCDSNGVTTSYTTAYSATAPAGYKVTQVLVDGIADACDNKSIKVTLTGTAGAVLEEATTTVPTAAGVFSAPVTFSNVNTLAESVLNVHVVISGTP